MAASTAVAAPTITSVVAAPAAAAAQVGAQDCTDGARVRTTPPANLDDTAKAAWDGYSFLRTCKWRDETWHSGSAAFASRPTYTYAQCVAAGVDNCSGLTRNPPSLAGLERLKDLYDTAYNGNQGGLGGSVITGDVMARGTKGDRPCMLINNNNIPVSQYLNVPIDRVDWAKGVNWRYFLVYDVTEVTRVTSTPGGGTTTEPVTRLQEYHKDSTAYWDSCYFGAGVQPVETPCPVFIDDVYATGPHGAGIPAIASINSTTGKTTVNPNTVARTFKAAGKGLLQPFGTRWDSGRYRQAKTYSEGAGTYISEVQGCNNSSLARQQAVPSMGNYQYTIAVDYVYCSYTIFPGFSNGQSFDGCQSDVEFRQTEVETWWADCEGQLRQGSSPRNMNPASCVIPTCTWGSADNPNGQVLVSGTGINPDSRTATGKQVNPNQMQVTARGGTFEITSPLLSMQPRSIGGVAPKQVSGTRGTLWEVADGSTPWRLGTDVNATNQFFKAAWLDTATPGAPILVKVPANAPYDSWYGQEYLNKGWGGIKLNLYQPSAPDNNATRSNGVLPGFYMRGVFGETWTNGDLIGQTTAVTPAGMVAGGPLWANKPSDKWYVCPTAGAANLKTDAAAMDRSWFSFRMLGGRATG